MQALTLQSRLQQGHHRAITYAPLGCAGPAHCVRSSSPGRPVTKTPVITPNSTMATPRFSSPAHSQLRLSRMRFHAAWMKIASKKHPCRLRYELRHRTSSNFFQVATHILELLRPAASRDVLQPDDRRGSHHGPGAAISYSRASEQHRLDALCKPREENSMHFYGRL